MAIFKRKRNAEESKADGKYTVLFKDHTGAKRRLAAFANKAASAEMERSIIRLVSARQANAAMATEDNRFLESAPVRVLEKLQLWGIITTERASTGKGLVDHIVDWKVALEAKGNTAQHISECGIYVTRIAKECNWRYLTSMNAADFSLWLKERKASGSSAANINHHVRKIKAFANWLAGEKRLVENPFTNITLLNELADRRLERRALEEHEIGLLLGAANDGPVVHGMAGHERALLYQLAIETGLRWSECRSLMRGDFNFDQCSVRIQAVNAKNRKDDEIPLSAELSALLKEYMALFAPLAAAFPTMTGDRGGGMIAVDLEAAGIPVEDEYGRKIDFHALRHTCGTRMARNGVPLAVAQKIMRHSSPVLTANYYTHVLIADKAREMAKLPTITPTDGKKEISAMTGTDDEATVQATENLETKMDTKTTGLGGKIRGYTEVGQDGNSIVFRTTETKKAPVRQGPIAITGGEGGIRTLGRGKPLRRLSKPVHSTTLPPLRHGRLNCSQ